MRRMRGVSLDADCDRGPDYAAGLASGGVAAAALSHCHWMKAGHDTSRGVYAQPHGIEWAPACGMGDWHTPNSMRTGACVQRMKCFVTALDTGQAALTADLPLPP